MDKLIINKLILAIIGLILSIWFFIKVVTDRIKEIKFDLEKSRRIKIISLIFFMEEGNEKYFQKIKKLLNQITIDPKNPKMCEICLSNNHNYPCTSEHREWLIKIEEILLEFKKDLEIKDPKDIDFKKILEI
jgi:hypothetical protein